jgi:hypothetical protein
MSLTYPTSEWGWNFIFNSFMYLFTKYHMPSVLLDTKWTKFCVCVYHNEKNSSDFYHVNTSLYFFTGQFNICPTYVYQHHKLQAVYMSLHNLFSKHFVNQILLEMHKKGRLLEEPWREPCVKRSILMQREECCRDSIQCCVNPHCCTCVLVCRLCLSAHLCSHCLSFCLRLQTPGGWPTTSVLFIEASVTIKHSQRDSSKCL